MIDKQQEKEEYLIEQKLYDDEEYFLEHTKVEDIHKDLVRIRKACMKYGYDFCDVIQGASNDL